jgi:hypothetical protein
VATLDPLLYMFVNKPENPVVQRWVKKGVEIFTMQYTLGWSLLKTSQGK